MSNFSNFDKQDAIQDFRDARRKAAFQSLLSFFSRKEQDLLRFDDIKKQFGIVNQGMQSLEYIELDKIIGSVGRYKDFDRNFLPKFDSDLERWAGVRMAMTSLTGVPPIDVYQIGEVYFVLDGNHRVSASRSMKNDRIEAYVTKFNSPITLTADDNVDDLLLKAEYVEFLNETKIKSIFPEMEFVATAPGRYKYLLNNILFHRQELEKDKTIENLTDEIIIKSWVNTVYLPMLDKIQTSGLMRDFPNRTKTDLYLWLLKHQDDLEKSLGWKVNLVDALKNLRDRFGRKSASTIVSSAIKETFIPENLDSGPKTGSWREETTSERTLSSLFSSILVPLSRNDKDFVALKQALIFAKQENAILRGLIVLEDMDQKDSSIYKSMEKHFYSLCKKEDVQAELVYDQGQVATIVSQRSVWNDLVVLHLFHAPADDVISRLRSGLREIIQRSSRPVLIAPSYQTMNKIMVAYDGSEKAKEALYLAAYIATMWEVKLYIYINTESRRKAFRAEQEALQIIDRYSINASFLHNNEILQENIIETINENKIDLLLMGGYGQRPLLQMMVGSTVDHMLRETEIPIIICR